MKNYASLKFKDKYGEVWTKIGRGYVHNHRLGWGLWDRGRGLKPL